ncbi:MAG: HNH endonuclease [Bacteroidales bacterium]
MTQRNWTKEELILAFNLYLKLPFGKMHRSNPDVIYLAALINRTPSSVAMRLSNYASIDPFHRARGIKGLPGGAKQCQPIWDEFEENREDLIFTSEQILANIENETIENKFSDALQNIDDFQGETKIREIKTRVNQNVFRQIVLSNYTGKCALSGIDISGLLVASHIIPWSVNEKERLNPENGICLSSLYDKAYDRGFIGITTKHKVLISDRIAKNSEKEYFNKYFSHLKGLQMNLPEKYYPKKEFLEYHLDEIFEK